VVREVERFIIPPNIVVAENAAIQIGAIMIGSTCLYLDQYVATLGWEGVRRNGALDE
jgi:hypothetical protein